MPSWNEILNEIRKSNRTDALDVTRRKYIKRLNKHTDRNVIIYYSAFLEATNHPSVGINDSDKNAIMSCVHNIEKSKGLDLILHTPGGNIAAAESLINYLREMFGDNIRTIIPQIAMSAGTLLACMGKEIVMGKQSNLGPIDPQFNGISAHGVKEEFERAMAEVVKDPNRFPVWQPIIGKYHPTFLGDCEKAITWSEEILSNQLSQCMFRELPNKEEVIRDIVKFLGDHQKTKSHSRHIHARELLEKGLNIIMLEDEPALQDIVMTIHHTCMHTIQGSGIIKMVENQKGIGMFLHPTKSQTNNGN